MYNKEMHSDRGIKHKVEYVTEFSSAHSITYMITSTGS
jgi:hypothetical protein